MPVSGLKCRFWSFCFFLFKCRFGCLSANFARLSDGFGDLSAGFCQEKKKQRKIKISRKGSPSCALNNTKTCPVEWGTTSSGATIDWQCESMKVASIWAVLVLPIESNSIDRQSTCHLPAEQIAPQSGSNQVLQTSASYVHLAAQCKIPHRIEQYPFETVFKGRKPTPKTTHPNKKNLRKQFSGLFVQIALPLSFSLKRGTSERVWQTVCADCFQSGLLGWVVLGVGFFFLEVSQRGCHRTCFALFSCGIAQISLRYPSCTGVSHLKCAC